MGQWLKQFVRLSLLAGISLATGTALADSDVVRLATTTSTENSGLLQDLLPRFHERTGLDVHVLAVGTGQALELGRRGDVDVVLVHAPPAEERFVDQGYGVNRRSVMYNDFVVVGPPSDPAAITAANDVGEALRRIAESESTFVSRGDDSGTHKKERSIWRDIGVTPQGRWYREAGQGMGKVLQIAGELHAYTLTDRGTWLAYHAKLPLQILNEGDPLLYNPYGIIAVNPERYKDINYIGAMQLIAWITSREAQHMISEYRVNDEPLFVPMAVKQLAAGRGE